MDFYSCSNTAFSNGLASLWIISFQSGFVFPILSEGPRSWPTTIVLHIFVAYTIDWIRPRCGLNKCIYQFHLQRSEKSLFPTIFYATASFQSFLFTSAVPSATLLASLCYTVPVNSSPLLWWHFIVECRSDQHKWDNKRLKVKETPKVSLKATD